MVSAPVVAAMHDRFPEAIEEEVELLDLDLAGYVLEWHARVPDWRYRFLTPDQIIAEVRDSGNHGPIVLHPLVGGMPDDEAWNSVQLLVDKVLPALT